MHGSSRCSSYKSAIAHLLPFLLCLVSVSAVFEGTGVAPVYPKHDHTGYLVNARIGRSWFRLLLDTGSSDLWVYADSRNRGRRGYVASLTKQDRRLNFATSYQNGVVISGNVYRDSVTIGGVTARSQLIGVQTLRAHSLATSQLRVTAHGNGFDGILGMGGLFNRGVSSRGRPYETIGTSYFGTIMRGLESPLFAISLNQDRIGFCSFGMIPSAYLRAIHNLVWVPVLPYEYNMPWWIPPVAWVPGLGSLTYALPLTPALVDSGCSTIIMPQAMVALYLEWLQIVNGGQRTWIPHPTLPGTYLYKCDTRLNDLAFYFANRMCVIRGDALRGPPRDHPYFGNMCELRLLDSEAHGYHGRIVLGLPFFFSNLVVFMQSQNNIPHIGFMAKHLTRDSPLGT